MLLSTPWVMLLISRHQEVAQETLEQEDDLGLNPKDREVWIAEPLSCLRLHRGYRTKKQAMLVPKESCLFQSMHAQ